MDRDVGGPELRVDVAEKPSQADGVDDEVDPSVCDFRRQRNTSEDEVHDVLNADPHFRRVFGCVQRVRQQQEQRVIWTRQEEGNGLSPLGLAILLLVWSLVGGHAEQKRARRAGRTSCLSKPVSLLR